MININLIQNIYVILILDLINLIYYMMMIIYCYMMMIDDYYY